MAFDVLVVDDSLTVRIMLKRLLGMVDVAVPVGEVREAGNGTEGLSRMRERRPDLVMADLNMEGMSGLEMIEAMRTDPLLAGVPVVVISSEGNDAVLEQLARMGVRECFRKPFDLFAMRELLGRVLETAGIFG